MSEAVVFDEKFVIEKKDTKGFTNGELISDVLKINTFKLSE
jgi:hypothetical protein